MKASVSSVANESRLFPAFSPGQGVGDHDGLRGVAVELGRPPAPTAHGQTRSHDVARTSCAARPPLPAGDGHSVSVTRELLIGSHLHILRWALFAVGTPFPGGGGKADGHASIQHRHYGHVGPFRRTSN